MFNLDTRESVQIKDGVNYSFDYGNAHIAVVNTNDLISVTIPQLKWLKNAIIIMVGVIPEDIVANFYHIYLLVVL